MNPLRQFKRYLIYKLRNKTNIDIKNYHTNSKLDELFSFFNSDKATIWDNGKKGHGFSKFYEKHFKSLKDKKINILEIGSFSGASAASFANYLPLSTIYCLDINITNFKFKSRRIKVFSIDVSKKKMVDKFYKNINISDKEKFFDVIIDDGSHKLSDTLNSINFFFKNLKPGGLYVIEDFKFPDYHNHLDDCNEKKIDTILQFIKNKEKFDSNIINNNMTQYLIDNVREIFIYKGLLKISDIAFIEKLNQ